MTRLRRSTSTMPQTLPFSKIYKLSWPSCATLAAKIAQQQGRYTQTAGKRKACRPPRSYSASPRKQNHRRTAYVHTRARLESKNISGGKSHPCQQEESRRPPTGALPSPPTAPREARKPEATQLTTWHRPPRRPSKRRSHRGINLHTICEQATPETARDVQPKNPAHFAQTNPVKPHVRAPTQILSRSNASTLYVHQHDTQPPSGSRPQHS